MRIGIDISPVIYGTGVSVYTKNLVESLISQDKKNEYVLFGGSLRRSNELKDFISSFGSKSNVVGKVFPIPPTLADVMWNKLHLFPIERFIGRVDVFHSSDWTQPPCKSFKVTTIHDLSPIICPNLTSPKIVKAHKKRLHLVKKEVDRVIVPSNTTKYDLLKLGFDVKKIRVIPEAIEKGMKRVSSQRIANLRRKYRISGKYLMAIGVNLRKNTKNIIKAYEKIKTDFNARLVILGHKHVDFEAVPGVIFTGFVPNEDLAAFYSGAEALVYPSFYEGFGIPILYSFSCKTPVVTSNVGSMAEIANKAAVLVDPNDIGDIAKGIINAIKNKNKLIKAGLIETKKYSWENIAFATLKVYSEY